MLYNEYISQTQEIIMTETLNTLRTAEQSYADACEANSKAWKFYSVAVDLHYAGKLSRPALEEAYLNASALEEQASVMWHDREGAKVAHLEYLASQDEECTCTPISTCEPCAQRARNSDLEF